MDIKNFANGILKNIRIKVGDGLDIKVTENRKNNGVIYTALTVFSPERKGGPSISINRYYEEYKNGVIGMDEIAEKVYTLLIKHEGDLEEMDTTSLFEWDKVREYIYAKLVNAEMNKESLAGMPHRKFLDLAVVYYVVIDGIGNGGAGTLLVQDEFMKMWGQDEESLYRVAYENMRVKSYPVLEDMRMVLSAYLPEELQPNFEKESGMDIYILTNRDRLFGAVEILDRNILRKIGDRLESDFIVLPSSVHEMLIVPSDKEDSYQNYAGIVCDVNREQVLMEERLSDHVYLYEREKGILTIAA